MADLRRASSGNVSSTPIKVQSDIMFATEPSAIPATAPLTDRLMAAIDHVQSGPRHRPTKLDKVA